MWDSTDPAVWHSVHTRRLQPCLRNTDEFDLLLRLERNSTYLLSCVLSSMSFVWLPSCSQTALSIQTTHHQLSIADSNKWKLPNNVRHHVQGLAPAASSYPHQNRLEQDTQLQDWQRNAECLRANCRSLQYKEREGFNVVGSMINKWFINKQEWYFAS